MNNIRFYQHPAQSTYQKKSKQALTANPKGVKRLAYDLNIRIGMAESERTQDECHVTKYPREYESTSSDHTSTVLGERDSHIDGRPRSSAHSELADSNSNVEAARTSSIVSEAATCNDRAKQQKFHAPHGEVEQCTSLTSLEPQYRDDQKSEATTFQGAQLGTPDLHQNLDLEPCRNAARLKSGTHTPVRSAHPGRSCSGSTYEISCTSLDHNNTMLHSGYETSMSPLDSRGSKAASPPFSVDAGEQPVSTLATSSRHRATSVSGNRARSPSEHCVSGPAVMLQTLKRHAPEHDIAMFPIELKRLWIMSAIVSSLHEVHRLSNSIQAWPIPRGVTPGENFTILSVRPLNDQQWLLLAKVSCLHEHEHDIRSPDCCDERLDQPTGTKRRKGAPSDTDSSQDSGNDDYYVPEGSTKKRLRKKNLQGRCSGGKSQQTCFEREPSERPHLKRGNWQEDEDQELTRLVETETPWPFIFAKFPYRSEAAVRSRWYCTLRPLVL